MLLLISWICALCINYIVHLFVVAQFFVNFLFFWFLASSFRNSNVFGGLWTTSISCHKLQSVHIRHFSKRPIFANEQCRRSFEFFPIAFAIVRWNPLPLRGSFYINKSTIHEYEWTWTLLNNFVSYVFFFTHPLCHLESNEYQ